MVKTCSNCGKEVKFLKGEYYTPAKGRQVFLCKECLGNAKEGKIKLKEIKEEGKTLSFIIIVLVSLFNIILFVLLFAESIRVPGSPGDTELLITTMLCGALSLIYIIFVILLAIFSTKMKKEHLFTIMILDVIVLICLLVGNIIIQYI